VVLWPQGLSAARLVVWCCGQWFYQQQGWWCGAVANGFIMSKADGVVLWQMVLSSTRLMVWCCGKWF
jgi:hypothetical protein